MSPSPGSAGEPPSHRAGVALLLLLAVNTANFYDRQVISALAEPIRLKWELGDQDLGRLGTAFILVYAVMSLPMGRWCDLGARRWILAGGVFLWGLFTAGAAFARSFRELFLLRLGVGVGEASCAPAASSWIGDLFPPARRGRAFSVFMLGLPLGISLSYFVSGRVAQAYGLPAAFLVAGLPGVLCSLALLWLPEPPRRSKATAGPALASPGAWTLLRSPTYRWITLSGVFHNFNMYTLGVFLGSYLIRHHGLTLREAGDAATLIYGLPGFLGLFLGGRVADRVGTGGGRGRLLAASVCTGIAAPLAAASLLVPAGSVLAFAGLLAASCVLTYVYYSTVYPAIQDLVRPELRARAMSVYLFAMYVCGGALGPYVTGSLSDRFTRAAAAAAGVGPSAEGSTLEPFRAAGLRSAFWLLPVLSALTALVLLAAARSVRRDPLDPPPASGA